MGINVEKIFQDVKEKVFQDVKKKFQNVINNLFWTFLLQGVSFIMLGVLVYFYPGIIAWLFVVGFIYLGIVAIVSGWRIKQFGKRVDSTMSLFNKK